jgi:hypothetical protein
LLPAKSRLQPELAAPRNFAATVFKALPQNCLPAPHGIPKFPVEIVKAFGKLKAYPTKLMVAGATAKA